VKKKTQVILASIFFALVFLFGINRIHAEDFSPEPLVKEALDENPELKSISFHIQSLQHKSKAVQKWMDPTLAVEYSNFPWDSWSMGESPMSGIQFKLQQTFSLPGKNARREKVIKAEAYAMSFMLEEKRLQLAALIRRSYWNLTLVRQLAAITERHIGLIEQLVEVVRAKYQVGKVGQHDLMRLQLLQEKLKDDLADFNRQDQEVSAIINAALHRKVRIKIETSESFESRMALLKTTDELLQIAIEKRPMLKALQVKTQALRLAAKQAQYERWPDITFWLGYRIRRQAGMDNGTDQMTFGMALPLPFDYTGNAKAKYSMNISEELAYEQETELLLDRIGMELERTRLKRQRAVEKVVTYRDKLIPDAQRLRDSTLSAYQSDRADFATVYQVELQLLEFERSLKIAESQILIQDAALQALTGSDAIKKGNLGGQDANGAK